MSNFEELLKERRKWNLDCDSKLFQKINTLQYNIVNSAHNAQKTVTDIGKQLDSASVNLNNAINVLNSLKFNKFVENVRASLVGITTLGHRQRRPSPPAACKGSGACKTRCRRSRQDFQGSLHRYVLSINLQRTMHSE